MTTESLESKFVRAARMFEALHKDRIQASSAPVSAEVSVARVPNSIVTGGVEPQFTATVCIGNSDECVVRTSAAASVDLALTHLVATLWDKLSARASELESRAREARDACDGSGPK